MRSAHTAAAVRAAEAPLLDAGRGPELMRRAALGLAYSVTGVLRSRRGGRKGAGVYGSRVALLIGSGNNGGDALYAGAHLAGRGARTTALLTSADTHADALAAFAAAGGRILRAPEDSEAFLAEAAAAGVVIDGLLGTGGRGGLREPARTVVAQLCDMKSGGAKSGGAKSGGATSGGAGPAVVACDLPSGTDPSTGEVHPPVLAAEVTATFGAAKTGLLCPPAEQLCGRVDVIDIGLGPIPGGADVRRLEDAELAALLPVPASADHKYTRGVAGVVAGSARYPGAALLAVAAASACGPGMVRYLGDPAVAAALAVRSPEAVCSQEMPADVRVQAWLAGPGIDGDPLQADRARAAMASGLPMVVDAAALPLVSVDDDNGSLVLTPHAGELAALLERLGVRRSRADIEAAPLAAAREAAALTGATVLLKGPTTVVAAPGGTVFTQADGLPSLATAGSGDTLAGILVALLAMGVGAGPAMGAGFGGDPAGGGSSDGAIDAGAVDGDAHFGDGLAVAAAAAAALHGRLAWTGPAVPLNSGMLAGRIPQAWRRLTHPG